MELLQKLENVILGWVKPLPHLPEVARKWLGSNVWWIVMVGAILMSIAIVFMLFTLLTIVTVMNSIGMSYYSNVAYTSTSVLTSIVSIAFAVASAVVLFMAVKPLQLKQKKGWTLLFVVWLVGVLSTVVNAILSMNPVLFITGILFGAIGAAISGYFLFEIHSQFAHVEKSRGVKEASKVATK